MSNDEAIWAGLFGVVIPAAAERIDFESIGLNAEDFGPEAIAEVAQMLSGSRQYQLPTAMVALFLSELPREESTNAQWWIGRTLADQLIRGLLRDEKKRGRPTKAHDRFFVAAYIEWCFSVKELDLRQSLQQAAKLFGNPSIKTLERWYLGQKGDAAKERELGRRVIELFEMLPDALGSLATEPGSIIDPARK